MNLVGAILLGIQFKRLEKPLIFFTMLISFLFIVAFGLLILVKAVNSDRVTTAPPR